jgi:hypothetical protein
VQSTGATSSERRNAKLEAQRKTSAVHRGLPVRSQLGHGVSPRRPLGGGGSGAGQHVGA